LHPLDIFEILISKNKNTFLFNKIRKNDEFELIKEDFENYLIFGGYPEVILEKNIQLKKQILSNIKNTYLLKEVKDILGYKEIFEFENILKFLAINDGKILNKNSISMNFGIHNNKVKEIIEILEKTAILHVLHPYLKNKSKELIKSPKTYLFDLGFKNILIKNFNELSLRQDKGEIYENFILNILIKNGLDVKYWNYKKTYEMDFVVESEKGLIGFEIKSKLTSTKISKSIKKFIDENKPKKIYVLCENIDQKKEYKNCPIIFTNHLNIFKIIKNLEIK